METITLELPDFWATALFYDDTSGFEYEDDKQFQDFCDWAVKNYGTSEPVDREEEDTSATYHDAKQFRCSCLQRSAAILFSREQGNPKTSAMTTLAHTMK